MTKQKFIETTVNALNNLPEDKAKEISDFAELLLKKYEETYITESMKKMVDSSKSFGFLQREPDLYSEKDLIKVYNG